jgi:hypothetical protein
LSRSEENQGFRCVICRRLVVPLTNGSYRNHCPFCLTSLHVDVLPGDRRSLCRGVMDAFTIRTSKKGWQVAHRCRVCGVERANRIAEDTVQPDEMDVIIRVQRFGLRNRA